VVFPLVLSRRRPTECALAVTLALGVECPYPQQWPRRQREDKRCAAADGLAPRALAGRGGNEATAAASCAAPGPLSREGAHSNGSVGGGTGSGGVPADVGGGGGHGRLKAGGRVRPRGGRGMAERGRD